MQRLEAAAKNSPLTGHLMSKPSHSDRLADIDLESIAAYADGAPHAQFRRLRREAPVFWHERPGGTAFWAVTRWAETRAVLSEPETHSSASSGVSLTDPPPGALPMLRAMLPFQDPPVHVATRKRVLPSFARRQAIALEGSIRGWATQLIDRALALGECDFVASIASELPARVITHLLGLPSEDGPLLRDWTDRVTEGDVAGGVTALNAYLEEAVRTQRASGTQGELVARIGSATEPDAVARMLSQIVQGGTETMRSLLSCSLLELLEHPDQLALLRREPQRIPDGVEEMLRIVSPVHHLRRTATRDTELGGQQIGIGERVVVFLASANRDEAIHRDPDRFDVARRPQRHLALGYAQHFCVGAHFARLEARVFWEEFLARVKSVELTGSALRVRSNQQNSLSQLPVRLR